MNCFVCQVCYWCMPWYASCLFVHLQTIVSETGQCGSIFKQLSETGQCGSILGLDDSYVLWLPPGNRKLKSGCGAKSNSTDWFFFFFFSHYIGIFFPISTYMKEVLQQIDFSFYMEREMWCLSFLLGIGEKLLGNEKNKGKREMKNQSVGVKSAGVGFFNINFLYWEKVKKGKRKINLLELL